MKEKILQVLGQIRPDVDFETAERLIDDGVLDSFDIIQVVLELNETFNVEMSVDDLRPENLNNVPAMIKLITRLQNE